MSRFVAMFNKLAADAQAKQSNHHLQPSSDLSHASRVLSRERVRSFLSSSSSRPSIDHSDALRQKLLRSKIINKAHHIISLDRHSSSSSWNLPPSLPFSLDGCNGGVKTNTDEAQSIAANNAALDVVLFGDSFTSRENESKEEDEDFCSKQPKIRKIEETTKRRDEKEEEGTPSHHFNMELLLPSHLRQ